MGIVKGFVLIIQLKLYMNQKKFQIKCCVKKLQIGLTFKSQNKIHKIKGPSHNTIYNILFSITRFSNLNQNAFMGQYYF